MIRDSFNAHVAYIQHMCLCGGPDTADYECHLTWYDRLASQIAGGQFSTEQIDALRNAFGDAYRTSETMQGAAHVKQYGYPGDFSVIERIYSNDKSSDPRLRKFDEFFHAQAAPQAVRNRKDYFKNLIRELRSQSDVPLRVLNLACGPCREMKELFDEGIDGVEFVCVDGDESAISHAKQVLNNDVRVEFVQRNILRYTPTAPFHLVWSAGLFDYFDDRVFVRLFRRFLQFVAPGGEIVIGNFGMENPTRSYMEALAQWYLHHRTDAKLNELVSAAGANGLHHVCVDGEPLGINRFVRVACAPATVRFDAKHGIHPPTHDSRSPEHRG